MNVKIGTSACIGALPDTRCGMRSAVRIGFSMVS